MIPINKNLPFVPTNIQQEETAEINRQISPTPPTISDMGIANASDGFELGGATNFETSFLSSPADTEVAPFPSAETVDASSIFQPIGNQQIDLSDTPAIENARDHVQEALDQIKAESSKESPSFKTVYALIRDSGSELTTLIGLDEQTLTSLLQKWPSNVRRQFGNYIQQLTEGDHGLSGNVKVSIFKDRLAKVVDPSANTRLEIELALNDFFANGAYYGPPAAESETPSEFP
jgi:hypothetical protein